MKRLLSLVLSLSLLITMSTGFADNNEALSASKDAIENISLPDIIEEDEAIENKYVGRLAAMEQDLSTFVFANEDGTQTLRMFSHPVKFVDEEGKTKDITLDIAPAENGAFKTKDNSIITTFEKKLADGISLEYDDIDITMKPKLTSALSVASSNGKTVTYPYGRNTKIEYSLTYTGFKEDIVVEEYTGQTEYEFTLYTNGLKVEQIGEGYKVVDNEGNIKANIGDIIIFTVDERNNTFGELTCVTVRENEEYLLTVHVDADYLSDPKTVYPIRIDPTIEINYSGSGASAIEDVTINSTGGSDGSSGSLRVGKRETYGISRILMKFPALSAYASQSATVINASVEIRDIICESDALEISCYQFTGNTWNESTANWSNVNPNSIGTLLSSNTVSYANGVALTNRHRYSFDITSAVLSWKTNTALFSKGIVFKAAASVENGSTYISKTFSSYERSSNQPSLSIVYAGSVSISKTMDYVMVGKTKAVSYTTNPSGLNLTWTSSDTSVATVNSSGVVTGIKPGIASITASHYDSSTGTIYSGSMSMHVMSSVGIQDDTNYYIMNRNSLRYISLETASDVQGTNVFTRVRSTSTLSQWKTEKQTDGSFQLINEYSPTGKVLNANGTNINIYADSNAATSKFEICRVVSSNYKGLYVIIYGSYFVAQDSNYNVYLTSTISENILWSFMAVEKGNADIYSFDYWYTKKGEQRHFDTTGNNVLFESTMNLFGYSSSSYTNPAPAIAFADLRTNDIFVFRGHGEAGRVEFYTTGNNLVGRIVAHSDMNFSGTSHYYINNLLDNELCKSRCVLYLGCSTGVSYTVGVNKYNLVDATYEKGAHFVLGTTETVYTSDSNDFLKGFLEKMNAGGNVEECVQQGIQQAGNDVSLSGGETGNYPIIYVGDTYQYLQ